MAKQDSVILIKGTIGDLSFYKTRDGYFVRRKTCIPGARVKRDLGLFKLSPPALSVDAPPALGYG